MLYVHSKCSIPRRSFADLTISFTYDKRWSPFNIRTNGVGCVLRLRLSRVNLDVGFSSQRLYIPSTFLLYLMSTVVYCVYHKVYYKRPDTKGFTFFGVNEVYPKKKEEDNILEYKLDIYEPLLPCLM